MAAEMENLNVKRAIVHYLDKDVGGDPSVTPSTELLPQSDDLSKLTHELLKSYNSTKRHYGIFGSVRNANNFEKKYKNTLECRDDDYINQTTEMTGQLQTMISGRGAAKGGYVTYIDYVLDEKRFFGVFLIRNTEGYTFQNVEGSYTIEELLRLDLKKLAMACRIDHENYEANDNDKYLTFLNNQSDISDYFLDWINTKELESNESYSKAFVELLKNIRLPTDEEGNELHRQDLRDKIHNICKNTTGRRVDLHQLSETFYGDRTTMVDEAERLGLHMQTNFPYVTKVFDTLKQVKAKAGSIELDFNRNQFGNNQAVSIIDGNTVKITSQGLVHSIREQTDN